MTQAPTTRRPRADAQRNRERIIEAADAAFRESGLDVSVAEIARRAGVGSGTLFRNFPTKDDLIRAIIEQHMNAWLDVIDQAIAAEDTESAFEHFFDTAVKFNMGDRGVMEAAKDGLLDVGDLYETKCVAFDRTDELLGRAKKQGIVAKEFTREDIYAMATGAAESANVAVREGLADADAARQRYVKVMLAGMRP